MNRVVTDHIAATDGCRNQICGMMWICTEHVTWNDIPLHVGSNTVGIVGVQKVEDGEFINSHVLDGGGESPPWPKVVEMMEADPRFLSPPTDEEVEAAAQAALRLYEEMSK